MNEITRPNFYRAMKYWGKKPHNVWRNYIKKNSSKGDIVLDPFVGSGMTYIESLKIGRVPYTIDLNPISELTINSLVNNESNIDDFKEISLEIIRKIRDSKFYKNEFTEKCIKCNNIVEINNYLCNGGNKITYKCNCCNKIYTTETKRVDTSARISKWYPKGKLDDLLSINKTFIDKSKNRISNIWSNRNLKLLSEIYDLILKVDDKQIKELLVFTFIQCVHLTSKMCVPRNEKSNRPLSTSWGRPAYMMPNNVFEQNPLIAFEKAVFNSTGTFESINNSRKYLEKSDRNGKHILGSAYDSLKKVETNSVDLIITDPPYGDIIQYGDLSEVWNSWLIKYNSKYKYNHKKEIIINKKKNTDFYENELYKVFFECNRVLKNGHKFIVTFNSRNINDWTSLLYALKKAEFNVVRVNYQINKRSSEANVAAKEGIAISDYYLVCEKGLMNNDKINKVINRIGV